MKDPIIEEVRQVRKKIETDHGNDWDALTRHLIAKEKDSSAKVVSYAQSLSPIAALLDTPRATLAMRPPSNCAHRERISNLVAESRDRHAIPID